MNFQNFHKSNFVRGKFLKSYINLPWGYARSHKKYGPYQFYRLLETNKHPDRQAKYGLAGFKVFYVL